MIPTFRYQTRLWASKIALSALGLAACVGPDSSLVETRAGVSVRHLQAHAYAEDGASNQLRAQGATTNQDANGSSVNLTLQAVDADGQGIACKKSKIEVLLEVSSDSGKSYKKVDKSKIKVACSADAPTDVALVLDNSGSQGKVLEQTQRGAKSFVDAVLKRKGRASVSRVSTQAYVLAELSDDKKTIEDAIDSLFISRGWTALYDGVRKGHETLGRMLGEESESKVKCQTRRRGAVVLMTNGADNNSADEQLADGSDGMATSLKDLQALNIKGVRTPVFAIGLGKNVDAATLQSLTESTGGRYLSIADVDAVKDAFDLIGDYLGDEVEVCADLPPTCGPVKVRVSYKYKHGNETFTSVDEYDSIADCPIPKAEGKSATILMTMTNPAVPALVRDRLIENTARWVSPVKDPAILVVRDDSHHDENANDVAQIRDRLRSFGFNTTMMEEPVNGLTALDIAGFDMVWFSNPGYPMDDVLSFTTLKTALSEGVGVVVSGDDMTWSMGESFSLGDITHLKYEGNGTSICDTAVDNNNGNKYAVTFENSKHPMLTDLKGTSFEYGDDIDASTPLNNGEEVLAWATLANAKKCKTKVPVVVGYEASTKK